MMDRSRRIADLWNWLPTFRVVAEYESIHKAAAVLATSPSAVSRMVKLLEDALGESLFVRTSTGLLLTTYGKEVLDVTRRAMRLVHDGISGSDATRDMVVGAVDSSLAHLLGLALVNLAQEAPLPGMALSSLEPAFVVEELLRGNVDLVVAYDCDRHDELTVEPLGTLSFAPHVGTDRAQGKGAHVGSPMRVATFDQGVLLAQAGTVVLLPCEIVPRSIRAVGPASTKRDVVAVFRTRLSPGGTEDLDRVVRSIRARLASP